MKVHTFAAILLVATCGCGTDSDDDDGGPGGGGASSSTGYVGHDICDLECVDVPTFRELSWNKCVGCHASDPDVRRAEGVPADADFTTYEGVASRIRKVGVLVSSTSTPMPPSGNPPLTVGEKAAFTKWSCCGGPE